LEIPVSITPQTDSLALGDTLRILVKIDKDVPIFNSNQTIRLDSFSFFTELFISEISGPEENYYTPVDTIVKAGGLSFLPLPTALTYPVM
jgi:hypothetical protein